MILLYRIKKKKHLTMIWILNSKEHFCFENRNLLSTVMKTDIIVEGDGDSSVMKKLHLVKPYGDDFVTKEIECSNHILRNYVIYYGKLFLHTFI
ncbi:uncharacterized protein LOC126552165 isoform X2 [Aphis gossypii]|uniref:uncharacterized protein LOC126552165 isoform X2 n=1 Tax=Aphis gossypii TaxID=80765 RepID=UPI0021595BC3|nr:uncharacterized protein LOC126552165 isoform X2 [Aphis gossypii]